MFKISNFLEAYEYFLKNREGLMIVIMGNHPYFFFSELSYVDTIYQLAESQASNYFIYTSPKTFASSLSSEVTC